jgi:hypothetical protein
VRAALGLELRGQRRAGDALDPEAGLGGLQPGLGRLDAAVRVGDGSLERVDPAAQRLPVTRVLAGGRELGLDLGQRGLQLLAAAIPGGARLREPAVGRLELGARRGGGSPGGRQLRRGIGGLAARFGQALPRRRHAGHTLGLEHGQPHRIARASYLRGPQTQLPLARPRPQRGGRGERGLEPLARLGAQRFALGGRLLEPALQLGRAQLEHLDGLQRLGGDPRLRLLGGLGAAGAALGQHRAVDHLAARLVGLLRALRGGGHGRRLDPAAQRRQAGAGAARPLQPQRVRVFHHELGRDEIGPAPRAGLTREAGVGQRVEPVVAPALAQGEHGQVGLARRLVGPDPAHAHEAALGSRGQPLDRGHGKAGQAGNDGRLGHGPPIVPDRAAACADYSSVPLRREARTASAMPPTAATAAPASTGLGT